MRLTSRPASHLAALVLAAVAAPAGAQRAPARRPEADTVPPAPWERRSPVHFAVGGGGLFQWGPGSGGSRLSDGGGFDAFGALQVSALSLGVGYQRSRYGVPGASTGRSTTDGAFVEPRLSLAPARNFTPYVAGRVAFLRQRVSASGQLAGARRSLTALGAGVGTLVWLAPTLQLDLAAMYTNVRGRTPGETAAGGTFPGGTGSGAVLRAGLVFGLDNWGR